MEGYSDGTPQQVYLGVTGLVNITFTLRLRGAAFITLVFFLSVFELYKSVSLIEGELF